MKYILEIFVFLFCFTSVAQEKNIFHDRSFWKDTPSLDTVLQKIEDGNNAVAFNNNGFDATTNATFKK